MLERGLELNKEFLKELEEKLDEEKKKSHRVLLKYQIKITKTMIEILERRLDNRERNEP